MVLTTVTCQYSVSNFDYHNYIYNYKMRLIPYCDYNSDWKLFNSKNGYITNINACNKV